MQTTWPLGVVRPLQETIDFRLDGTFPMKCGALMRISPEEPQHALILKVAERISAKAGDEEMAQWKLCLLSASGRFVRTDTFDDNYFWVTNARRRFREAATAMVHLASQIICDIWMFKARKEATLNKTISASDVAELYKKNLDNPEADEEARTTTTTIESAITVYEKVFSIPAVRAMIESCDEEFMTLSPFNSVGKLLEIYYKCKSSAKMEWWFSLAHDAMTARSLEIGDFSLKKLRGAPSKPGLTELILTKRSIRDFLLTRFLDTRNIHADYKQKLRDIFATPSSFRKLFRPLDGSGDTSFLATWPAAASKALDMIETVSFLFCGQEDAILKTGIKAGKTAQEILEEYQPFKAQIEEIDALLKLENSTMKTDEDGDDMPHHGSKNAGKTSGGGAGSSSSGTAAAGQGQGGGGGGGGSTTDAVAKSLTVLEDAWIDHVRRHISKFCVLIVESSLSQTQLQQSLQSVALGTIHGGRSGNVIVTFDCNLFGESITAAHVRKPPLQQAVINKIWKAVTEARKEPNQNGLFPTGDVLVLIDGGRKTDQFLTYFSMGKDRKNFDKNRKQREGDICVRGSLHNGAWPNQINAPGLLPGATRLCAKDPEHKARLLSARSSLRWTRSP